MMEGKPVLRHPGVLAALGVALLFGAGTPLAKGLLASVDPLLLARLLYLGSGLGLNGYHIRMRIRIFPMRTIGMCTEFPARAGH